MVIWYVQAEIIFLMINTNVTIIYEFSHLPKAQQNTLFHILVVIYLHSGTETLVLVVERCGFSQEPSELLK